VQSGDAANASINSGNIASGAIGWPHLASGAVQSGDITNAAVVSGSIASGSIDWAHFVSGATITRAQFVGPFTSGTAWTILTQQVISGLCAVSLSQSGTLQVAQASVSGTMPAIGIVIDNVASGIQANVYTFGVFQLPVNSGQMTYSGYLGTPIYVGRSGQIVTTSGAINSGGFLSGDIIQSLGLVWNSGGIYANVDSPAIPASIPTAWQYALSSGQATSKYNTFISGNNLTTQFAITHNLNTQAIHVQVRDSSGNRVITEDQANTANTCLVGFFNAPAINVSYNVIVIG